MSAVLTPRDILAAVPQREPFRFIDEILEIEDQHVIASYRFRPDHDFYRGHFPGRPLFYRRRKLRSEVRMHLEDGTLVCSGQLSGVGVAA